MDNSCCICSEVYDLTERRPLLLPCSHSFCRSCLEQIKSANDGLCPICRNSWGGQPVDNLPFIRQLATSSDTVKIKTKEKASNKQSICAIHNADLQFWCKMCNVSICSHCFIEDHKECDLIHIKEKTADLVKNLRENVVSTRTILSEKFTGKIIDNNSILTDIREAIKKLRYYENTVTKFAKKLSAKQEKVMEKLKRYENTPSDSNINLLTSTISKTLSLLEDQIIAPTIPKFNVASDCGGLLVNDSDPEELDTDDDEPITSQVIPPYVAIECDEPPDVTNTDTVQNHDTSVPNYYTHTVHSMFSGMVI